MEVILESEESLWGCEFEDDSESKFSEGIESRSSGDERKGEESCGGGGVSEEVGAWGSMIGGAGAIRAVDVGRLECLMLDFPLFLFFFFCSGRPALLVRWRIESTDRLDLTDWRACLLMSRVL